MAKKEESKSVVKNERGKSIEEFLFVVNLSTEIINKSGSESWYNYLLYVMTLTLDEYFILKELNRAIHINFPYAKEQGIKLGFWIDIPSKLSDTTVSERPAGAATAENN